MSKNYEIVKDAILNKNQIHASYNGFFRKMCPHVIGTKNMREQALFYQFSGESKSGLDFPGSPRNWRCIPIEKLINIKVIDGEWYTAPNHSRPQTCVDNIDVEVS